MNDDIKIYKTRDSATSLLRKCGIKPRDYDFYIEKLADGRFACHVAKAELARQALAQISLKSKQVAEKLHDYQQKAIDTIKPRKRTVSAAARELIVQGRTNEEVWASLQAEFKLGDEKKSYPAWYRSDCKRKGLI